jgi:hypothetical protein
MAGRCGVSDAAAGVRMDVRVSGEQQLTRPNNNKSDNGNRKAKRGALVVVCGREQQQQHGRSGRGGGIIKYGQRR